MNDRELLELAAKAASIDGVYSENWKAIVYPDGLSSEAGGESYSCWNPLRNDGDALRLAVDLHIDIRHFMYENGTMDCLVDRIGRCVREAIGDDPYAATRRAIVRAAAEIGRSARH